MGFSWTFVLSITVFLLQSDNASRLAQASTKKSISIFDYCGVTFLVEDVDWHEVFLDGTLFPTGLKNCEIKYTARNSYDKLNYKVTEALIYRSSMFVQLESSSNGENYSTEEMINYNTRPSNPNQPVKADRRMRLSVGRTSGYVKNSFSVIIEIFGDEYREDNSATEPERSLSATATFGITTGICLAVISIVVVCVYIKRQDLKRKRIRAQVELSRENDGNTVAPSVQYTPSSGEPNLSFIPPYRATPGHSEFQREGDNSMVGDNITYGYPATPPPYSPEDDKPPSYIEAMKMGLSEVTI